MKKIAAFVCLLCLLGCIAPTEKVVQLKLIQTSDVHGNYFPYDFIRDGDGEGGLARICYYVINQRKTYDDRLLLLDNGDIIQGAPSAYYYNYIDTSSVHLCAEIMNFMQYDAGNMGNHDLETGHSVYDRWVGQCDFPVLGANIVRVADGEPYFKPYEIFVREGIKIAVLGMVTPAIPAWLHESLWEGMRFDDMEESARKWMKIIQENEKPDMVIGLFHTGREASTLIDKYREDASVEIAQRVPGFDVLLIGHDHLPFSGKVASVTGDSVLIVNPGSGGLYMGDIDITVTLKKGKVTHKEIQGRLADVSVIPVCPNFMAEYAAAYQTIANYVSEEIGELPQDMDTRVAYFGPSLIMDFIHTVQLDMTGADISFASPLSFDANIPKGKIQIRDVFHMYEFENFLYMMQLTGAEVKGFLEESYALWVNQMTSPDDHLLLLGNGESRYGSKRDMLASPYFLFDSAAGIIYTVDVTKPKGARIHILQMKDGTPFDEHAIYKVAMPSYRGNGGGELLIKGAQVSQDELKTRIMQMSDKDIRYYMIQYVKNKWVLTLKPLNQWKFVPEDMANPAARRDYEYLFGENPV